MRTKIYVLISVPVFILLYSFTSLIVFTTLIFAFLRLKFIVRYILYFWANSVFYLMGKRLRISGMKNIGKNGKYILIANHSSLFDIMAIMSFYPNVSWFGHERLMKVPVFKTILKMTNYVPMRPANIKNTKLMLDQLISKSQRHTIAIFPEGTRTLDGNVNDFFRGFIQVLRVSEISVLPVTLNGFFAFKPKNRFYIKFNSKLSVKIHPPINKADLIEKSDTDIINVVRTIIESSLIKQEYA